MGGIAPLSVAGTDTARGPVSFPPMYWEGLHSATTEVVVGKLMSHPEFE